MSTTPSYSFPVEFRDVHYIALLYRSNTNAIQHYLKSTRLKPALVLGGKPLVAVGLIQYKDSDLGAYHEVIIAIPVVPVASGSGWKSWLDLYASKENREIGQYIIQIPVTTQQSVDAGRNIWGYPKTLLPIDHQFEKSKLKTTIFSESQLAEVCITGSLGIAVPVPGMNLMTYSLLNNQWMKTWVDVNATMKCRPFADIRISLKNQTTEIATCISELGITNQAPFLTLEATKFKAQFHAPEPCIMQ